MEKYTTHETSANASRILTNDVYLTAYLLTQQCRLERVLHNERQRVSFVVEGRGIERLRRAYKAGPVYLNVRFFRDNLVTLRRLMDGKQRSASCPKPVPSPMRLSKA